MRGNEKMGKGDVMGDVPGYLDIYCRLCLFLVSSRANVR